VTGALNPLSKVDKTILLYNAVTPSFAEENEYAFKVYANANQEAELLAEILKNQNQKIGIAYVNNPSANLMLDKIKEELDLVSYTFEVNETDFKTIILKLKEAEISNTIILGYPNQILDFVKQTIELDYTPENLFANSDGSVSEVVNEIEDYLIDTNIKYVTVGYGSKDQNYLFGYDLAKVLVEGMKQCQEITGEPDDIKCLKQELLKVKLQGKSGALQIDESGVAIVSPELYTVKNKELVPYEED